MRKIVTIAAAVGALCASASVSMAAQGTVPFTGLVTSTCVLTVGTPGILAPNTDFTQLSSTAAGGSAGTIAILSTGASFKVSTIAPTAFTAAPAGGGDSVSFSSTYSGSGATTIGSTSGVTQTTVNSGLTNLSVNLLATKSSGNYTGGAYAAEVIVRCE